MREGLARESSIEVNSLESADIRAGRDFLWPRQKIYVSHLPGQTQAQTVNTCAQVAAAGFEPVPHVPVRLLKNEQQLDGILSAIRDAGASSLLLISGDYVRPEGPYREVLDVMRTGKLQKFGFTCVSVAGHPEGHPAVAADEIRRAQIEKARCGVAAGLQVTLVTQFFFEATPFVDWARDLRRAGVEARIVAGLPGPATAGRLLALARHCGVGPSIRVLSSRYRSMFKLLSERSPGVLLDDLAAERRRQPDLFDGIHLYSFGGFLRTAAWLRQQAELVEAQVVPPSTPL
ncbi:MAG TPA: methylenetetrahydrofolate reductase [Steroidobacteraceae bacterium]|nr:methylenetetrahydrofolate reductase [Steroidobacteraceae bacterium]